MRLPDHPTPDDLHAIPGFAELLSRMTGTSPSDLRGDGIVRALLDLHAAGLSVASDERAAVAYDRSGNVVPSTELVHRLAARAHDGAPLRLDPHEALHFADELPPSSERERAIAVLRPATTPRAFEYGGDDDLGVLALSTVSVGYHDRREPCLLTVSRRIADGRVTFDSRFMPLPERAISDEFPYPDLRGLSGADVLRAHADGTPEKRSGRWLRGAEYAFSSPREMTRLDVVDAETSSALRRFILSAKDAAADALGELATPWRRGDAASAARKHAFLAGRPRPERFRQAFASAPFLGVVMVTDHVRPPGDEPLSTTRNAMAALSQAADAIDAGTSVRRVVERLCEAVCGGSLSRVAYRSLAKWELYDWNLDGVRRTAWTLDACFPDPFPHRTLRTRETTTLVAILARCVPSPTVRRLAPKLASAMRNAEGSYRGFPVGFWDVYRWVGATVRLAGLPDEEEAECARFDILFPKGRRLGGIRDLTRRWHSAAARLQSEEDAAKRREVEAYDPTLRADLPFPTLPSFPVPAGMDVEAIVDDGRCVREGAEMSNCVATYASAASLGETLLFSVRNAEGRSTLAIGVGAAGGAVELRQVFGPGNGPAPPSHVAFASALVSWCGDADLSAFLADREEAEILDETRDAVLRALPDDSKARIADAAFGRLGPFIPEPQRSQSRERWIADRARRP